MSENFYSYFREFLLQEARSIEAIAQRLKSDAVEKAVKILLDCKGKVIVTGVGKSGVIANKIAETMTSTGTVAVFLHPTDALHGGLGVITKGDCVIAISNSGETDEILMLLPALERRNVSLIAIVGNTNSTLARRADVILDASVEKEACPLNLAPTNSTTVALAIGDALAMTLVSAKGLTAEDFAANHPAGRLGKRLTLRVKDLMHASPDVKPESSWFEVVSIISKYALGAATVVDEKKKLLGIITDGDLRRTVERIAPEKLSSLTAEQMMTRSPITAEAEMLAYDALKLMENRPSQISVLPVVENGKCVGLVRLHDIVRSGL
ncbi:MAG: KpsF/GutQ family sugar-phosphate isomerase [Pyrinomonadaceae bacterium]|nr:KpsF/GutQ family sugar-phosphate isomerase [Pyrinomonadaceae bacterium]MCX7638836.1 KpsF/GutQ family sugar-phosphate isomerase [Pyrinomonadaceae bacterium]MDW8305028.1 KpsF/GutQ family sugar-phosphate isomerase [Acidobacteriota bacterium]